MKPRKPLKITSRTSSVTNGFVQAILPDVPISMVELEQGLAALGQKPSSPRTCVYCGAPSTDSDHFKPLVSKKRPSGYLNEARNLVPACGTCNQSKSGQNWRVWMTGRAAGSPQMRGVTDVEQRIAALERFEKWAGAEPRDFAALVGEDLWQLYWARLDEIERLMHAAQAEAEIIKAKLSLGLKASATNAQV